MRWHRPNSAAGRITSPFGPRGPIVGAPNASRLHLGVDLRAGTLTVPADIYAAAAGTVRRIYKTPLGAWVLELDHGDKVWTRYVHMQLPGIAVKVGDRVTGGQRVAAASNSGAPTIHLHFEVLIGGKQVDPVPWLQARGVDLAVTTAASGTGTTAGLKPAPPLIHTPIQEDDMSAAEVAQIRADINTIHEAIVATRADVSTTADEVRAARADVATVHSAVLATAPAVVEAVLSTPITRGGAVGGTTTLAALIAWHDDGTARILDGQDVGGGVDPAEIRAAITASVEAALADVSITLTPKGA